MKSVHLLPYCPWPPLTGMKVEMMKHLDALHQFGDCKLVSARGRPVGFGWTAEAIAALQSQGYSSMAWREDQCRRRLLWWWGALYAGTCKSLGLEQAFGHGNPYHRYAFPAKWWYEHTRGYDLAVVHYSFWAHLPTACPQVVVMYELLSNYHWGAVHRELIDLQRARLVIVVGYDEAEALRARGLMNVLWNPPIVPAMELDVNAQIGLVGTLAPQNLEGLRWLERADAPLGGIKVRVYGNLAQKCKAAFWEPVGSYGERYTPYRECGIQLLVRGDRPGVQIKAVEALACGRAIIARRGSMRGLPPGAGAWIEVDTPDAMLAEAVRLQRDTSARQQLAASARAFHATHLEGGKISAALRTAYQQAASG